MSLSGTASKNQSRRSSRRHRTKDLEQEVELIMSQEDDSDMEMEKSKENDLPTTPKSHKQIDYQHRSPSVGTNDTLAQTPRRSTRKSIKPVQEYEDIVSRKRQLRSASKIEAENIQDADEEPQAKWTPAKVGRVSQKRSRKSRKSTKNQNKSKIISSSEAEDNEYEKDSLKTNTSEESLQIQDSVDTVESEAVAEKNMDILINKITENKAKYTNENIGSELSKEQQEDCINFKEKDSLKTNTSEESLPIQDSVDTVESEAVAEKNMDILINKITENKAKYTNENIGSELRKEQQEDCINFKEIEAKQGDGVGTYLKNDTFNTSDLGINPLPEEIEENEGQQTNSEQKIFNAMNESFTITPDALEVNNVEVPVVINNEDSGYKLEDQQKSEDSYNKASGDVEVDDSEIPLVIIKDDTLNNSDCVLVNKDLSEHVDDDMQPLRLSDEESSTSPPRKAPRVILTNEEGKEQILNSSTLFNAGVTPKRYSKTVERKPTPFRPKATVPNNEEEEDCEEGAHSITIEVSKMEPKEIVLRSIRKRSLSVCIGNTEAENRRKNVTFYSPANQTTILEDLDTRIVQSVKKNYGAKTGGNVTSFVTQRRKRSMSFDEALINK
ncbi:PREDICTED: thioredoxin domain-containing protein 2-like, partial [Rhagoletis zephyria]|uniref:thioredoxin domain-containing protein 2-like n=1 Tax=Rhagoletis zephyria TaxID=28612 RepID=UPI000811255D